MHTRPRLCRGLGLGPAAIRYTCGNLDSAVVALTHTGQGTALEGDDFSIDGGVAVLGQSTKGTSAEFSGGSAGTGTCSCAGGPGWLCPSDRNLKEGFKAADLSQLLLSLDHMPVTYYRMKGQDAHTHYLGPTVRDLKTAFKLGDNDTTTCRSRHSNRN